MDTKERVILVVGGLLIVAVGGPVVYGLTHNDTVACEIESLGIETIAEGITRGQHADTIKAGMRGLTPACERAIDTWVDQRSAAVTFKLDLGSKSISQIATGIQIANPPSAPPGSPQRIVDCLGWESSFLFQLCVDGTIRPPQPSSLP